ncbi:MAG: amidohydrolase family protein [Thermodesulfobacteriota bacterium]|nr:amidohydrolase family protein [Thermodesulfobacteriota bacterium]
MIIDIHTHLFPDEVRNKRQSFCRRDDGFRLLYENEKARMASPDDLIKAMARDGVQQSVICGFPWEDPGLCREGNEYLLECSSRFPDHLIPFACLPSSAPRLAQKELERCLSRGMPGVGELAFYRRKIPLRDMKNLVSVLRPLSGLRVPLLLHTNEPVGHEYPGKSPENLQTIYQFLLALPDVHIILAHWGGGFFFYELMPEVARAARNVYYDTAASPFLYRPQIYNLAVKIVGPGRILFGSDYPLIPPARYFGELKSSGLSARVQARIKGLNAGHLLYGSDGPGTKQADHV